MSDPFSFCPFEAAFFKKIPGLFATALLFSRSGEVHAVQHNLSLLPEWPEKFFTTVARVLDKAEACALGTNGFRLMLARGFVTGFRRGPGVYLVLITQKQELSADLFQVLSQPSEGGDWLEETIPAVSLEQLVRFEPKNHEFHR